MTETPTATRSLRKVAPLAAAGCAALFATVAARRGMFARWRPDCDPPDRHLAEDEMEALATSEGMPEPRED
jgi:hypothetical protein